MSSEETVILTKSLLEAAGTSGHGFTRKQLAILGIDWPPYPGWKKTLIGSVILKETYQHVLSLKGKKQKKEKPRPVNQKPVSSLALDYQMIEAMKVAYRHASGDMSVTTGDCMDALMNALCESIGDKGFQDFVGKLK